MFKVRDQLHAFTDLRFFFFQPIVVLFTYLDWPKNYNCTIIISLLETHIFIKRKQFLRFRFSYAAWNEVNGHIFVLTFKESRHEFEDNVLHCSVCLEVYEGLGLMDLNVALWAVLTTL